MPELAPPWPAHAVAGEGAVVWTALLLPPGQQPEAVRAVPMGGGFIATDRVHLVALDDHGELLRLGFVLTRRIDPDLEAAPRDLWFVLDPRLATAHTRRVELVVQGPGFETCSAVWTLR